MDEKVKFSLTANQLKLIAATAMLIDHIAWLFVPFESILGQLMHLVGRMTAPIMCYFIAEGYYHTKNIKRYLGRLAIFAVISHLPYQYFMYGDTIFSSPHISTSVVYTLLLGLVALIVWNRQDLPQWARMSLVVVICLLAMPGDWMAIAVLWILYFGIYRGDFRRQMIAFSLIGCLLWVPGVVSAVLYDISTLPWQACMFGIYLVIPLLSLYRQERGRSKVLKHFFYVFYPLHMLVLGLLASWILQ